VVEQVPARQLRALYDAETVTVYQAYPPPVAYPAVRAGRLAPTVKHDRMTWIKPSFRTMLYRANPALNESQDRILAVQISRAGFEWALARSCPNQYDRDFCPDRDDWAKALQESPVRFQWDPERSLQTVALPYRALQVGLTAQVMDRLVEEWTVDINDVTHIARNIGERVRAGKDPIAENMLPGERPYPLPEPIAARLHISR
jgi:hypothetical protein